MQAATSSSGASRRWGIVYAAVGAGLLAPAGPGFARDATSIDSGDIARRLTSSALVLMMPALGLALSDGGLVPAFGTRHAGVIAMAATFSLAIVGTLVRLGITSAAAGSLRFRLEGEFAGLDLSQHSEDAYAFATGGDDAPSAAAARGREAE
jgi:hypothetical protein